MKTKLLLITTSIFLLFSCNSSKILTKGKTYENFRGFVPIDPVEYMEKVALDSKGEIIFKYPKNLTKEEILGFLANETVLVSVGQFNGEGNLGYGPASFSVKRSTYKITMDYMKFATLRETNTQGDVIGYKRVGVGLRIIANVTAMESGVNLEIGRAHV